MPETYGLPEGWQPWQVARLFRKAEQEANFDNELELVESVNQV